MTNDHHQMSYFEEEGCVICRESDYEEDNLIVYCSVFYIPLLLLEMRLISSLEMLWIRLSARRRFYLLNLHCF